MQGTKWILVFVAIALILSSACYAEQWWAITYTTPKLGNVIATSDDRYLITAGNKILKLRPDGVVRWYKGYVGTWPLQLRSIQNTADGGYIAAGRTRRPGTEDRGLLVLKLRYNGTIEWQKAYVGTEKYLLINNMQQTSDGGYILPVTINYHAAVLKLNSDGSIAWQNKYGLGDARAVEETVDGHYMVAGEVYSDVDVLRVMKLTSGGIPVWKKIYDLGSKQDMDVASLLATADGCIVAGTTYLCDVSEGICCPDGTMWMSKLDADGDIVWGKLYEKSTHTKVNSLQHAAGGGILVAAETGPFDGICGYDSLEGYNALVFRANSAGNIAWWMTYGKPDNNAGDSATSLTETADGYHVMSGFVSGFDNRFWVLRLGMYGQIPGCYLMGDYGNVYASNWGFTITDDGLGFEPSSLVRMTPDLVPQSEPITKSVICSWGSPNPPAHLAFIREKTSGKQGLFINEVSRGLNTETDPPIATDRHFGNSNWGNNIIAMTCLDTNGDGSDEVAVIRQRSNGRQRLEIYSHPQTAPGDTGDPIASDRAFGNSNSDRNNVAIAGLDINGDGVDEIAVLREKQTGKQGLFIFNAPQAIGVDIEPSIANYRHFGNTNGGQNIVAMSGVDINTDGIGEIAVIRKRTTGQQRLEIYNAPQGVGAPKGDPVASDLTFGNSTTNKNNIALTRIDINNDGKDEIAVVRENQYGRQRLEIYNTPESVGGETGLPIASDLSFGKVGTNRHTKLISGMGF